MQGDGITQAVEEFFALLRERGTSSAEHRLRLADVLDRLCTFGRHPTTMFEKGHPDPPQRDASQLYRQYRQLAEEQFPGLGPYNLALPISGQPADAHLALSDPYDDIADIALDFAIFQWAVTNTTLNNALWYFQFGYDSHWGDHANNLRWYLYAKEHDR